MSQVFFDSPLQPKPSAVHHTSDLAHGPTEFADLFMPLSASRHASEASDGTVGSCPSSEKNLSDSSLQLWLPTMDEHLVPPLPGIDEFDPSPASTPESSESSASEAAIPTIDHSPPGSDGDPRRSPGEGIHTVQHHTASHHTAQQPVPHRDELPDFCVQDGAAMMYQPQWVPSFRVAQPPVWQQLPPHRVTRHNRPHSQRAHEWVRNGYLASQRKTP